MSTSQNIAVITLTVILAAFCAWRAWRAFRSDDNRTRNDRVAAQRSARLNPAGEQQEPGTNTDLLLDCIAIWDDPAGYRRLHNAIHQHRKENPQ